MRAPFELKTFIRARSAFLFGRAGVLNYRRLVALQPLILVPEPTNPKDPHAVMVQNLFLHGVGYVARESAPAVSAKIAEGITLLCKTLSRPNPRYVWIYIWEDNATILDETQQGDEPPARIFLPTKEISLV